MRGCVGGGFPDSSIIPNVPMFLISAVIRLRAIAPTQKPFIAFLRLRPRPTNLARPMQDFGRVRANGNAPALSNAPGRGEMKHLAICRPIVGPAPRAGHSNWILLALILAALLSASSTQGAWPLNGGGSAHVDQASPGTTDDSADNLVAEMFGQPSPTSIVGSSDGTLPGFRLDSEVESAGYFQGNRFELAGETSAASDEAWCHQILPEGLIYRSYLAGVKESRFGSRWLHDEDLGWMWDITLGGRVGILRYGTTGSERPEGWQLDMEGAGMPRLDLEHEERDLISADFRFGIPLTYGRGDYQMKFGYYHLSSHLGDEYMVRHGTLVRRNYSRDVLIWGHSYFLTPDIRVYGEAGWAFTYDGGTEPWEFQFGIDYSPAGPSGQRGAPFFAINGHLREEFDFGGNLAIETGWQWRGNSGHLFRVGMHYFQGMSDQWEFFDQYEEKLGFGVWYDF